MEMTKRKNRSIYHWVILVCCILILMFSYSTRVALRYRNRSGWAWRSCSQPKF